MELDQFKDVYLVIDKANDVFIQRQFVSQGDYKGRSLTVQVTNNGNVGEVPGLTLNLNWHNEASGLTDLTAFTILDKTNSIFRIEYPENMMTPGKVYASIQIIQDGKVTNLKQFELIVQKLAGQPVGIAENAEFSALVAVLADANKFRTDIDSLSASKADKNYINDYLSKVTVVPETFANLAAIKAKYPSGKNGLMVAADNGHKYIWANNTWTDAGVYQAVELVDGSVDLNSFNPMLKSNFGDAFTALDMTFTDGGYYNRQGDYVAGVDQMYAAHTLVKGDVVKVTGTSYLEMPLYVFVGADNSDTSYPVASGEQTFATDVVFEATQNGTLYINKLKWATNGTIVATKLTAYKVLVNNDSFENGVIGLEKLKTGIQDNFVSNFVKQVPTYTAGQYYNRSGVLMVAEEGYSFVSYAVVPGDLFKITGSDYYNMPLFIFISNSGGKTVYPPVGTGGTMFYNADFVATEPGTLYINKNWIYNPVIYKNSGHALKNNPLYNKLMYADGDSVALGQGSTNGSYVDIIAANNTMGYKKSAVGGTTLAKRAARTDSILERVQALTGTWDYILLEGVFNDLFGSIALGTLTSGFVATLDEFTVIGAAESLCKTIKTNYPNAKTLFVLGHRIGTGAFAQFPNQDAYWDAVITALNKWSIPYVDIRKEGGLCAFNQTWLTNYFGVGETMGTHPNYDGYLKFYAPLITAKMKAL